MSYRGKFSVLALSSMIALYAFVGGVLSPWTNAQQPINDAGAQIRIFESVLQHIRTTMSTNRISKRSAMEPYAGLSAVSIHIRRT